MALNCFSKSAEPIKDYKFSVGEIAGNAGIFVGMKNRSAAVAMRRKTSTYW
jgi:hypothetical protein